MRFMKIARRITGDINKSIVYYSKLGIFQSFIELDDINKLKNMYHAQLLNSIIMIENIIQSYYIL